MKIEIVEATEKDKEFVLLANKKIDECSFVEKSALKENIDKDLFREKRCVCLIAKVGNENVGMILFSKVYWADRGDGIYVSQGYVEKPYRKNGVFKKMLVEAAKYYPKTNFATCLVSNKNQNMIDCMHNLSFEDEDMISYVKNKIELLKILEED